MVEPSAHARLNGQRVVGVDSGGAIAVVVGLTGAPSPLWGDLLVGLEHRPIFVTSLKACSPETSPAGPPTKIEVRVSSTGSIPEALSWLSDAIDRTNQGHDAHQRRLAAVYADAVALVEAWFQDARASGVTPVDPTVN